MKHLKKGLVVLAVLLLVCVMNACSSVTISGDLVVNSDGTGSRRIVGVIDKVSSDENGITYYYFKLHGDNLKAWLEQTYAEKVPGSENWLSFTVEDGEEAEIVTWNFEFSSLDEYLERMEALCFDDTALGTYAEPEFTIENGKIVEYIEYPDTMKCIMSSIQDVVLADDTIYDDACTKDGESLNGGSGGTNPKEYGIGLKGSDAGPVLTIQVDGGEVAEILNDAEFFYWYTEEEVEETEAPATEAPEETEAPATEADETEAPANGEADETEAPANGEAETSNNEAEAPADDAATDGDGVSTGLIIGIVVAVVAVVAVVVVVVAKKKKAN